jgi:Protein of unknown function (DUF3037)
MPNETAETRSGPGRAAGWYSYAIVRVVPRVDRGEFLNVGVILFARTQRFLEARLAFDEARLRAIAPELDLPLVRRHLAAVQAICAGSTEGGPIAALALSERFHQVTASTSTVIQASAVHAGYTNNPSGTLEELLDAFVRPPH